MSKVVISPSVFSFVLPAMPSDTIATKKSIHGIHVETDRSGSVVVATNGNVMLMAHADTCQDQEQAAFTFIPDKDMIKACRVKRGRKEDKRKIELDLAALRWRLMDGNGYEEACGKLAISDMPYPEWRRILGQNVDFDGSVPSVLPENIEAIGSAAKAVNNSFSMHGSGENSPVMINFSEGMYFGLIMPIVDFAFSSAGKVPEWISAGDSRHQKHS